MNKSFRSSCLIASALDLIGDKWSLLIVRDMLMHHKKTFKDFSTSDENIATNLLSSRLKLLESLDILTKTKLSTNKKENIYLLTEKGIDLAPLIMEIVLWSDEYVRAYHSHMNPNHVVPAEKQDVILQTQEKYRAFVRQFEI